MYTFIENFVGYMESHGITYTDDINESYDILFVNSFMVDYNLIKRVKKRLGEVRVVQRVNGSGRDYGRRDDADNRQARVNMLTDLTVFQSRYSVHSTTEKFRVISREGPIIYNAVDTDMFSLEGEKLDLPYSVRVCHVTFSANPKKGLGSVYEVAAANPGIDFILCGAQDDSRQLPNIHPRGFVQRSELPRVMRSCDVLVFFSENESCSNVVLEGLASGLPVLYKDSGGTPELVGDCGLPVEVDNFREQIEEVLARKEELSRAACARAVEHFSPEVIFPQYIEAIERTERRPMPAAADFIRLWRKGYPVLPNSPQQLACSIRQKFDAAIGLIKR
jgi:glycosyltransferase involved in cell wall biosynthesis